MPATIRFDEQDFLRDKIVTPGWYELDIRHVGEWLPTKSGDSNNVLIDTAIVKNDDDGSEEFQGVPIYLQFNDKASAHGFIKGFLLALEVPLEVGKDYVLKAAEGRRVSAFIKNETWEGRTRNKPSHQYRKVRE